MDIDPTTSTPHDGPEDGDALDVVALELARALGAQLRVPPTEALRAAHVRSAAAAAAAATGGPQASDGHQEDRAAVGAITDVPGGASRRPAARGRTGGARATRRRAIPTAAMALLAVVAVVTTLVGRSGPDLPVIALGGGAPMTTGDATMSREAASASDMPAVGMIWIPVDYTFVLEDGARVPAGTGGAWRFAPPADLAASAARLTARFGMPPAVPSEWDPAALTSQTSAGATLTLLPSGEWYFSAAPDPAMEWRCPEGEPDIAPEPAPDVRPGEGEISILPAFECEPPPPAVGVPSIAEARRLADALFAELGMTGIRFEDPYADDWSVNLWGLVPVPGAARDVGQYAGVAFGGSGRILFANGSLARPVALGAYPTVSSEVALDRLRAQLAVTDAPSARPFEGELPGGDAATSSDDRSTPGAAEERQQVTVRLVGVELVTQYAWSREGEMLLVPHYRFRDADGGEWWVIAIADRYLEG
jgi:hypothetical protein